MTTNLTPQSAQKKEYDLLPEDVYNVVVESIDDDTRPVYNNPNEEEEYMKFTFRITDEGFEDRKIWANATPKLFPGSTGLSASTLYSILSAVNRKNYNEEEIDAISSKDVNELEGKALRLMIKQAPNTKGEIRNKIDGYLQSKDSMTSDELANEELSEINDDQVDVTNL